jgi:hypothetical protein
MLESIHVEITRQALEPHFSERALEAIIRANRGQDALGGQFGHDEYHFDNNAFAKSRAYIEEQRGLVISALREDQASRAWSAFGRLTHSAQDFYAHSNYVDLWLAGYGDATVPAPPKIDPVDPELIASPRLRSGKLYYPQEILYFIPGLRTLALSVLPKDSHAHMNLDSAERGPNFSYAFTAAVKRTQLEYEGIVADLSAEQISLFTKGSNREDAKITFNFSSCSSRLRGEKNAA